MDRTSDVPTRTAGWHLYPERWINSQRYLGDKVVPQLNHDLFSFTSAMKNGWQMNGRWKKNGIEIELFKRGQDNFRFDRMLPSGSFWLMVVKVKIVVGRDHSMIELGRNIPIQKLHYMMGHTGRHLISPTMKIQSHYFISFLHFEFF